MSSFSVLRGLGVVAGAAFATLAVQRRGAAAHDGALAAGPVATGPVAAGLVGVGLVEAEPPVGAVVVSDAARLRSVLDDPLGPRDVWLAPGTYAGDWTVRRTMAVHGAKRGAASVRLQGTGTGTVVRIDAPDVVLENVVVTGAGTKATTEDSGVRARGDRVQLRHVEVDGTLFGISLQECHGCTLAESHVRGPDADPSFRGDGIKLWESHDSVVERNLVERSRDLVVWYSRRVRLEGNVVRGSRYGAHFMYAHDGLVRGSRVEDNVVGLFVMYSARLKVEGNVLAGARGPAGIGIGFKESDGVALGQNWIVGNTTGIYLDRTPRTETDPVSFEGNVVALNDVAVRFHSSQKGLAFHGNDFRDNATLVEVEGGGTALGVDFRRNRWSDYAGYDLNGDGVGDVPFLVTRLSSELADAHPSLRFFHGTAAVSVLDAVARALPLLAPTPVLRDDAPAWRRGNGGSS